MGVRRVEVMKCINLICSALIRDNYQIEYLLFMLIEIIRVN